MSIAYGSSGGQTAGGKDTCSSLSSTQTTMMMKRNLHQELQNLANPEPVFEDPEDDANDVDSATQWINQHEESSSSNRTEQVDINAYSGLRKKQLSFLSSYDKRYRGKVIGRDKLSENHSDEDDIDLENEEQEYDDDDEDEEDEEDDQMQSDQSEDMDDVEEEEEESDSQKQFLEKTKLANLKSNTAKHLNGHEEEYEDEQFNILNFDLDKELAKANAVKNQLLTYDKLLETRIKMQKLLSTSNRFPQDNSYMLVKQANSPQLRELLNDSLKGLRKLAQIFNEMDDLLVCQSEVTKEQPAAVVEENGSSNKRKISLDQTTRVKRFQQLSIQYPQIVDSWHERTKFVHGNVKLKKFDSFEVCPTKSIEQALVDKQRLIDRTKIMRTEYKIIGLNDRQEVEEKEESQEDTTQNYSHHQTQANHNQEIYDDDDFYHQLLRQIVENKVTEVDDSATIAKKYTEIQRMRNKLKKKIDTKASKGRKIRYDVHEKLVNFMAPVDYTTMEDEAKDQLFSSLFGNFHNNLASSG